MEHPLSSARNVLLLCVGLFAAGACSDGFDVDLRDSATGMATSDAIRDLADDDPQANDRIAVAQHGETVADVARRLGLDAEELASYNGLTPNTRLNEGEVIALPESARGTSPADEEVDISVLAGDALDRVDAESSTAGSPLAHSERPAGTEPIRHQVVRGETAYSIARLYQVSVRSLADWNGLGPELSVKEGQYLIIPVGGTSTEPSGTEQITTAPGEGSLTPVPPSASTPLPEEKPEPALLTQEQPESTLAASRTSRLAMPVDGGIVRAYEKGKNEGIDIAADTGTPVRAAADGTAAVITKDTNLGTILVLRHSENLLTVYANVNNLKVQEGETVSRGQTIAEIGGNANYLHFEVWEGAESSVDPLTYLN